MFQLVTDCFESTESTSEYFTALQTSLQKDGDFARRAHTGIVGEAPFLGADLRINYRDREVLRKKRYEETLDKLRQYSFVGGVTDKFESVYLEQLSILGKLMNQNVGRERKLKSVTRWRRVSCIIFISASAALPISSLVVALNASRIAAAIAAAATIPVGSMGKWFDVMLKNYRNTLTDENELINILLDWTSVVGTYLDSIRILVNRLEDNKRSLLHYVDFLLNHEDHMRLDDEEMMDKMGDFIKSNKDLVQQANQCNEEIRRAGTMALERIKDLRK